MGYRSSASWSDSSRILNPAIAPSSNSNDLSYLRDSPSLASAASPAGSTGSVGSSGSSRRDSRSLNGHLRSRGGQPSADYLHHSSSSAAVAATSLRGVSSHKNPASLGSSGNSRRHVNSLRSPSSIHGGSGASTPVHPSSRTPGSGLGGGSGNPVASASCRSSDDSGSDSSSDDDGASDRDDGSSDSGGSSSRSSSASSTRSARRDPASSITHRSQTNSTSATNTSSSLNSLNKRRLGTAPARAVDDSSRTYCAIFLRNLPARPSGKRTKIPHFLQVRPRTIEFSWPLEITFTDVTHQLASSSNETLHILGRLRISISSSSECWSKKLGPFKAYVLKKA